MKILKFGGSSVGTETSLGNVLRIIKQKSVDDDVIIVISALENVTDWLQAAADEAAAGQETYETYLNEIEQRHVDMVKNLISVHHQSEVLARLKVLLNELEDILHGVYLVHEITPRTLDFILGFGERLSAYLTSQCISDQGLSATYVDAREIIKTDANFG